jgi:short-subunit dehydrogenase
MSRDLRNCRLLLTGASSGIGRALAHQAAAAGARLAVVSRSAEKLAALEQELPPGTALCSIVADITKPEDRERLLHTAAARFDGLDVLVNNAGVASFGHFATSSEAILRTVMETNFFAAAELIRSAVPILVKGKQPAIVNVSSMTGRRGMPAWSEYSASKYALCGLTEALRGEMARFDIDVLLIIPGLTRTDLHHNMLRNEGRMKIAFDKGQAPEKVAATILRALKYNQTEVVVGTEARWILWFNRWFPRFTEWRIQSKVKKLYAQG